MLVIATVVVLPLFASKGSTSPGGSTGATGVPSYGAGATGVPSYGGSATDVQSATPTESTSTVPETPTYAAPTDAPSARAALQAEVDRDRSAVEALVGSWVPQLSSKKPGLVADGITYDYPAVLANFQSLKTRYPDALLLWSGDYSTFKYGDFWVTVEGAAFAAGAAANSWCDAQGIGPDDCFAKRLSHSDGYVGNTLLRP
jgi:serine/threonine-protein kinase